MNYYLLGLCSDRWIPSIRDVTRFWLVGAPTAADALAIFAANTALDTRRTTDIRDLKVAWMEAVDTANLAGWLEGLGWETRKQMRARLAPFGHPVVLDIDKALQAVDPPRPEPNGGTP